MKSKAIAMVSMAATVMLCGCPTEIPQPPFNASGTFGGVWSGTPSGEGQTQDVAECPLTLTLSQNVAAPWPGSFAVNGTALIDYSCFDLPEWIETPPASMVNVAGVLDGEGKLTLLTGGCGTGLCVVLSLAGAGEDSNADGAMDTFDGTWTYTLLLAGVQPFGFTGSYTTDRAPAN